MKYKRSISLAGKVGDVSSANDVGEVSMLEAPPAEAALAAPRADRDRSGPSATHYLRGLLRIVGTKKIVAMAIAVLALMSLNVYGEIRLNAWQGSFYQAIKDMKTSELGALSMRFLAIVAILLSMVISQNWFMERLKIGIRKVLTEHLLDGWLKPGLAYRLNMTSPAGANPDQRIQEDVRNFSEKTCDIVWGAFKSSFMLVSFIGILWAMSRGIAFEVQGHHIEIPGYMVWFAILYAGITTFLVARAGAPLIDLNVHKYAREGDLRYSVVRVSESAESVAFYSGERDERSIIEGCLENVLKIMRTMSWSNARLTPITSGSGYLVIMLPILVALPGYLQGKLDFGGLMMVVGAFNQVQTALRWFVENFQGIADWRAVVLRVGEFRDAVLTADEYECDTIELAPSADGNLSFDKTAVSLVDGEEVISDATAQIVPGERVLIVGESGSGKSTLLRAVAGLWPWGSGRILLPPREEMMFLPQRPYMPLGTLAAALAYPHSDRDEDRGAMEECLRKVNLEEFIDRLDEREPWDKAMSLGQQQRLAFARLILHKPKWIFLDESTSALDDDNQDRMMSLLVEELSESAVMSIGHRPGLERYHTRALQLTKTNSGRVLVKKPRPDAIAPKGKIRAKIGEKLEPVRKWMFRPSLDVMTRAPGETDGDGELIPRARDERRAVGGGGALM